jgi:phage tail sheath gpL-like
MSSIAVGLERISRVLGYALKGVNFAPTSPNLQQRIAILGEGNEANQATMPIIETVLTSTQQAGELFGYGSPIYNVMRILKPISGDGVGGIEIAVYPQLKAAGSTARVQTLTLTGTATATATHSVRVAGRTSVDGENYSYVVLKGDTASIIAAKINTAIAQVLRSPVTSTVAAEVLTVTTKWYGATSQDVTLNIETNNISAGIVYAIAETTPGAGTPSIGAALTSFADTWNTLIVNTYGLVTTVMDALESFNGVADPNNPTGRFSGIVFKPLVAISGSVLDNDATVTDARSSQMTLAVAPAPLSLAMPMEAAANMTYLEALTAQNTPELDVAGSYYPDMPAPTNGIIGTMASYDSRDQYVKKGNSTVQLISGRYMVQDFVTTFHPAGDINPQFRYVRNIILDLNIYFGYYLLELDNVIDHVIANDDDEITTSKFVKPKTWKSVLTNYAAELARRGLIADPAFMVKSISVKIGATNPNRLETLIRYKRTGTVKIAVTTAEVGFNFGN